MSKRKKKSFLELEEGPNSTELKDEEVLRASLKEPAVFEILVERYQDPLTRAAWRIVRNQQEAEDIVQEAFVKIYKNAEKFEKLAGIEFKSWAYKITINTAITHYRKLRRGEFLTEDPSIYEEPERELNEQRLSFSADAKVLVARVLEDMPEHLRAVLERYYFEDKSYQAIAADEDISISTLKMRLFRAKKLFKKISNQTPHEV